MIGDRSATGDHHFELLPTSSSTWSRNTMAALSLCVLLVSAGCWNAVPGYETVDTREPTKPPTVTPYHSYEQPTNKLDLPAVPENQTDVDYINASRIEQLVEFYIQRIRLKNRSLPQDVQKWYNWTHNRDLDPVQEDPRLSKIALNKSWHMAKNGYLDHAEPDNPDYSFGERLNDARYKCNGPDRTSDGSRVTAYGAENLVKAYTPAKDDAEQRDVETEIARRMIQQWWDSDGHRAAILRRHMDTIGIGVYVTNEDIYGTMIVCP